MIETVGLAALAYFAGIGLGFSSDYVAGSIEVEASE